MPPGHFASKKIAHSTRGAVLSPDQHLGGTSGDGTSIQLVAEQLGEVPGEICLVGAHRHGVV